MGKCLVCNGNYQEFISFGKQPIANGFLKSEQIAQEYFFELKVAFCETCKTVQLVEQPTREQMFNENYAFFSSTSFYMQKHFQDVAKKMKDNYMPDAANGFVVEMGSNDGIMLKNFAAEKIKHLGIEPSANVAAAAREKGVNTIVKFFDNTVAKEVVAEYGKADIFYSANVMCHIPYIQSIAEGIKTLLKPKGVLVFEDPYLGDIIAKTSYDQIYDEHVFFFSVESVSNIFKPFGLEVIDVEAIGTHGGSMRYYLSHKGSHPIKDTVSKQLKIEKDLKLDIFETYLKFKKNVEKSRDDLVSALKKMKNEGKRCVGYGATSKSTTVLNYCHIGPELIEFITDTTPTKIGKLTPGAHIPVKSHADFKTKYPDYTLLFAWNHKNEIMEKEAEYCKLGGKWLTYVPDVHIY